MNTTVEVSTYPTVYYDYRAATFIQVQSSESMYIMTKVKVHSYACASAKSEDSRNREKSVRLQFSKLKIHRNYGSTVQTIK